MEERNYYGNLFDSKATILCHQVNTTTMGAGIAKQVRERYPRVYEKFKKAVDKGLMTLGSCQVVAIDDTRTKFIANLCGQDHFGNDGKRYTNYEAIYIALEKLAKYCKDNKIKSVAFPWNMSCDRGGASWMVISSMIEETFKNNDITIEFWNLKKEK